MPPDASREAGLTVLRDAAIDWDRPREGAGPGRTPESLLRAAERSGALRKRIARGEGGFYMNRSRLPAGFHIPPHVHDHDELLIVLAGGCRVDESEIELGEGDAVVIRARYRYGFVAGPQGIEFLTIRTGEAQTTLDG